MESWDGGWTIGEVEDRQDGDEHGDLRDETR